MMMGLVLPASAALTTFQQYNGNIGYSADGFGSRFQSGTISASVPVGSTVLAAYVYSAIFQNITGLNVGGTLNGTEMSGGSFTSNPSVGGALGATRFNVTSIVKPIIDVGLGGIYNFTITERSPTQDGAALVVVYSNGSLPTSTFAILDGFSAVGGDSFSANFATPLNPSAAGFFAEMALGIGFSFTGQTSTVNVNGTIITRNAGGFDDGSASEGALITVGGFDDPFSPFLPSFAEDKERYNLVPQITIGDTSISFRTNNPTNDDNIFLAMIHVSGTATVGDGAIPEPSTYALMATGILGLFLARRRKA